MEVYHLFPRTHTIRCGNVLSLLWSVIIVPLELQFIFIILSGEQ